MSLFKKTALKSLIRNFILLAFLAAFFSFAAGCNTDVNKLIDSATAEKNTYYKDADGDGYGDSRGDPVEETDRPAGYVENNDDCDDGNDAIHPGVDEICDDDLDNDCDGQVDSNDSECGGGNLGGGGEVDGDGDGVTIADGDCDDNNNSVYPGKEEVCGDGIDQNCNGQVDEGCNLDADGDGVTVDQGDCDDNNPNIHPGAEEIPNDGIDQNCDGVDGAPPGSDDFGNDTASASPATIGSVISGTIEVGNDVDVFSFSAAQGTTYTIETTLGTLDDSVLLLTGTGGNNIASDDDSGEGLASKIIWTCYVPGTYYVTVAGLWANSAGTYTLQISVTGDDHGDSITTSTNIPIGTTITGTIDNDTDYDYFNFYFNAGTTYYLDIVLGTLSDWDVYFYDTDGNTALAYGWGDSLYWYYTPLISGTYYLGITGYGTSAGTYTVNVYQ